MPDKSYVMKIEVDLDVYNELQAICALHGTTIESATEAFIRFSADPRNIGVLTKYLYAMERIYEKPVKASYLYFFHLDRFEQI